MAFKKFNPCSPCCTEVGCSYNLYPSSGSDFLDEAEFYYGLNYEVGEEFYNPVAEEYQTRTISDFEVLVMRTRSGLAPHYGYTELLTFLDRGRTIFLFSDYIGAPGVYSGPDYVSAAGMLSSLGASSLSVSPGRLHMTPDIGYYPNIAPENNLNEDIDEFWVAGASSVSGGFTILESYQGIIMVGMNIGSGTGKLLLAGDGNGEWQVITDAICNIRGQAIS